MRNAIETVVVAGQAEFDWRKWFSTVSVLQNELLGLLDSCKGRFDSNINSVGETADRAAIIASLRQLEKIINS